MNPRERALRRVERAMSGRAAAIEAELCLVAIDQRDLKNGESFADAFARTHPEVPQDRRVCVLRESVPIRDSDAAEERAAARKMARTAKRRVDTAASVAGVPVVDQPSPLPVADVIPLPARSARRESTLVLDYEHFTRGLDPHLWRS